MFKYVKLKYSKMLFKNNYLKFRNLRDKLKKVYLKWIRSIYLYASGIGAEIG